MNFVHKRERTYFMLLIFISIPTYLLLFLSGIGILLLLIFALIPMLLSLLHIGYVRSNGVKITPRQFPHIHEAAEKIRQDMGLTSIPDMYIMQSGGLLNAFATRFFGKNMVVLYSEIVEATMINGEEKLHFIIAHEMAHIKRNHIIKNLLILPGNWIPFLSEAYSRTCEYTCDRMASFCIQNAEASKQALTILAVGKELYEQVDIKEYQIESSKETNPFVWLSEKLSTHPSLPKRIHEITVFSGQETPVSFKTSRQTRWMLAGIAAASLLFIGTGAALLYQLPKTAVYSDFMLGASNTTPLMLAASENDTAKAKELLDEDADVNVKDSDGWTALHYTLIPAKEDPSLQDIPANQEINKTMVELLLKANASSKGGDIPLHYIVESGDKQLIKTALKHGGSLAVTDTYGETPLFVAVYTNQPEIVRLLLDEGADPKVKNTGDMTVLDIAKDEGFAEIVSILENKQKIVD